MRPLTLTASIFFGFCSASVYAELTDNQKHDFVRHYRSITRLAEEFPNKPEVKVVFVDLNRDGTDDALATSYGSFYETGWLWAAFQLVGGRWEPIKGYDNHDKVVRPGSGVYARHGEIFQVQMGDGVVEFLVLNQNFDKLAPEQLGPLNKSRFWIDREGILRQEKIENLERYLAYRGAHRDGLVRKIEAVHVEVFNR
jgi:hypothetical protein